MNRAGIPESMGPVPFEESQIGWPVHRQAERHLPRPLQPRRGIRNPRSRPRVWIFSKFLVTLEVRLELLWPILGPLDLVIHLGKVSRLRISSARAPELVWEPFFDRFPEKCEGF